VDLEFTTEQEELRTSVRSFLDKECTLAVVRGIVESAEAPTALWRSMVALDWPALAVAEEYGGVGLTFVETAVVVEELGRTVAPGPLLTTVSQFAPIVREASVSESSPTSPPARSQERSPSPIIPRAGRWTTSLWPRNAPRAAGSSAVPSTA
jgi:hypothetical protein